MAKAETLIQQIKTYSAQQAEWDLMKLKKLLTGPTLGERAFIRGSECILFEILD